MHGDDAFTIRGYTKVLDPVGVARELVNLLRRDRQRKEPDGRCSLENANFNLPLKAGVNEILIGVANDFYGWGIIARLDTVEGMEFLND